MDQAERLKMQNSLLETMLYSYSSNEFLRRIMVLQGGGALHFLYGSPRHSNDLDFVSANLSSDFNQVISELEKGILFDGKLIVPKIKRVNAPTFLRASYSFGEGLPSAKVEVIDQVSFDNDVTSGRYKPLAVESPSEIYIDKVVATLARMAKRGSLKSADLFDLNYLDDNLKLVVPFDSVVQKAESYDEARNVTRDIVSRVIDYITDASNHGQFRKDIEKTLLPDVRKHVVLDKAYFDRSAKHFERYIGNVA